MQKDQLLIEQAHTQGLQALRPGAGQPQGLKPYQGIHMLHRDAVVIPQLQDQEPEV